MDLSFKKKLSSQRKENTRFFNILNRLNHKTLDESIHSIHEEVFKNTNTNHGFIAQEVKTAIDAHSEIKDGFKLWDDRPDGSQEVAEALIESQK